jgi:pyruvate-ferredoxin/flavodoxin oxidoreductase
LLYRYHPERLQRGEPPLQLDAPAPRTALADFFKLENRFRMLETTEPRVAKELLAVPQEDVRARRAFYEFLAVHKTKPNPKV